MKLRQLGAAQVVVVTVVTIAGGVATVVFAGAKRYVTHAKTAEALRNLGAIETGEKNKYQVETDVSPKQDGMGPFVHTFCPNTKPLPPSVPKGVKVKIDDWSQPGWTCLKFSLYEPMRYQLDVKSNGGTGTGATYTATAVGDLDGDGVTSKFELKGAGTTTGDATRISLKITNEEE
jgi:hypothetical protein